jgi:hypothetical protein
MDAVHNLRSGFAGRGDWASMRKRRRSHGRPVSGPRWLMGIGVLLRVLLLENVPERMEQVEFASQVLDLEIKDDNSGISGWKKPDSKATAHSES